MNRLLVALLAAVDALIAAAVGVAAALAPLTVLWVLGLGGGADWGALWPASVRVWQLGQLVPLRVALPPEYLTATGIPADAATFWLSLAPLAFAGFTAVFAARSGARAAQAGAWGVGVVAGTLVTATVAWLLWRTSANPIAAVYGWQALALPAAVFALPALGGALVGAWRHGDDGIVDALRRRASSDARWRGVPEAAARGIGIAVVGFIAVGALLVATASVLRGGQVVALFESAHVGATGATVIALAQLAYLPTLVVWGGSFAAGPGFALGTGTAVTPAGTDVGALPGIPALGLVPQVTSPWLLLAVLLIVAVGFVAGAAARHRLARRGDAGSAAGPAGSAADAASAGSAASVPRASVPRLVALAAIVVGGGAGAALLAAVAAGSIGPGRLDGVGPAPGPVAVAVGLELLVGAAIALFGPGKAGRAVSRPANPDRTDAASTNAVRTAADRPAADRANTDRPDPVDVVAAPAAAGPASIRPDDTETEPFAPADVDPLAALGGDDTPPGGSGQH